jgi:hypothetical protein
MIHGLDLVATHGPEDFACVARTGCLSQADMLADLSLAVHESIESATGHALDLKFP